MIFDTEALLEEARVNLIPDALVTISFEGLALSCINAGGECEVGILRRNDHALTLDISRVDPPLIFEHELRLDFDIKIDITHPTQERAEIHTDAAYNRLDETSAPNDFRWQIDMEREEVFHGTALDFKTRLANGRVGGLSPIFIIPRGKLYTRQRLKKTLVSVRVDDAGAGNREGNFLGQIGHVLGIDITSENNPASKIVLTNVDEQGQPVAGIPPLELPFQPGIKYEIKVSNLCNDASGDCNSTLPGQGTDFRFYYEVVDDPSGKKFDLRNTIEPGAPGHTGDPVIDRTDLGVNGSPQACEKGHLSKTTSLTGR